MLSVERIKARGNRAGGKTLLGIRENSHQDRRLSLEFIRLKTRERTGNMYKSEMKMLGGGKIWQKQRCISVTPDDH